MDASTGGTTAGVDGTTDGADGTTAGVERVRGPRPARLAVALLAGALLALVQACAPGEPEVSPNDQVAAEDRIVEAEEGAEDAPLEGPTVVFTSGNQLVYDQAPTEMPSGPVVIELTCEGLPHNVVFEGYQGDQAVVECPGAGVFTGPANLDPGEWVYYCSIPGHRAGGMEGTLTVTG